MLLMDHNGGLKSGANFAKQVVLRFTDRVTDPVNGSE